MNTSNIMNTIIHNRNRRINLEKYKYRLRTRNNDKEVSDNNQLYFKTLFNNSDFQELLDLLPYMNYNKNELKRLDNFINFYKYKDQFNYDKIKVLKYKNYPDILEPLMQQYEDNIKTYELFKSDFSKEEMLIIDLVNKSKRYNDYEKYNESILYLYRAMELIAEIRLQKRYSIKSKDLNINRLYEYNLSNTQISHYSGSNYHNIIDLSLKQQLNLLYDLRDSIGDWYMANKDEFNDIIYLRHSSVLIHGSRNISYLRYEYFEELIMELVRLYGKKLIRYVNPAQFPRYNL